MTVTADVLLREIGVNPSIALFSASLPCNPQSEMSAGGDGFAAAWVLRFFPEVLDALAAACEHQSVVQHIDGGQE